MQGNTSLINLMRQHAFIIFWSVLVLYAGAKLSIIGFTNRHEISPTIAFVSVFVSMSFWLIVAPVLVKTLKKRPLTETKNLRIYIPLMLSLALLSLCWTSISDIFTTPGTPSFRTQMALKLMYQLGWEILLGLVFLGLLFWSKVGSITLIIPADEKGKKREVKFKVTFNNRTFYVNAASIHSIESKDYYVELYTGDARYLIREPIYRLAENLAELGFHQISRSAIVNISYVKALIKQNGKVYMELKGGIKVKVSRSFLPRIQEALADPSLND